MRFDAIGLFWEELDVVKPLPKEQQPKRTPPARFWEAPDYLPGLEEAQQFDVVLMSDDELVDEAISQSQMVFDVECYVNYFLVCFRSLKCKKVVYFEMYDGCELDTRKLAWLLRNYCLIGFNSRAYDLPIIQLALAGATNVQLKEASDKIILQDASAWDIVRGWEVEKIEYDHIDLIEVAPLMSSLKIYGGRLHANRMWDLPFHPHSQLTREQMLITRWYCINDLDQTELLEQALHEHLLLRKKMGEEYGLDLRSLSDAQIAEAVISQELKKVGIQPTRQTVLPGTIYRYQPPAFIIFQTQLLKDLYTTLLAFDFVVGDDGYVKMPVELEQLILDFASSQYRMGMGGLHSCEKNKAHICDGSFTLVDRDVSSYYPEIILNSSLYPEHLGPAFLSVYRQLVERRLAAKHAKNKVVADCLKIVVNGTFGKLGSKWSIIYAPNLLFQVTITGQLSLLMLIERMEMEGIKVISANTDGIVLAIPLSFEAVADQIVKGWERDTNFETEATEYRAIYSRDVNSYIAIKTNGSTKNKGAYSNPWAEKNPSIFRLHKNPVTTICIEAAQCYLVEGTALSVTIRECVDIRKFITVRTVKGGAVWGDLYLGKAIRWYYAQGDQPQLVYATSGNLVPKSAGAVPLMTLPDLLPENIDYAWYEAEAFALLKDLGCTSV